MNTAEDYIERLRDKNPWLVTAPKISITPAEFEKQIALAYEQGIADLHNDILGRDHPGHDTSMPDFMRQFFGGRRS